MPRKAPAGRSDNAGRHVRLYHWLMKTEAWRDLSTVARCAYIELASRYGGAKSNNGRLPYSIRELADALHISKATASRALSDLQDHGFIVCTKQGAFNQKVRHATEWRLTEFPDDVADALPTKDFVRWRKFTVSLEGPIGPSHETDRSPS